MIREIQKLTGSRCTELPVQNLVGLVIRSLFQLVDVTLSFFELLLPLLGPLLCNDLPDNFCESRMNWLNGSSCGF